MLNTKILFSLLLVGATTLSFAEGISEEEMKKALEGITQTRVMKASEPKIVSEVIVTDKIITPTKEKKASTKKSIKKKTKIYKKKKVYKKKKIYKKKKVEIDMSELKEVQTLGVVSKSEPFELKN